MAPPTSGFNYNQYMMELSKKLGDCQLASERGRFSHDGGYASQDTGAG